jgi:hypothetical protein
MQDSKIQNDCEEEYMARNSRIVAWAGIALALGVTALSRSVLIWHMPKKRRKPRKSLPKRRRRRCWKKMGVRPRIRQTAEGICSISGIASLTRKGAPLFSHKIKPYIIDQATGAVMAVPDVPKLGSMRSTRKPVKDKNYAILFANPQKHIKPGNKVTVVIGDFRAENLVVE